MASGLRAHPTIRVALIWEHGGGLGHQAALGPLAARLIEANAHVQAWVRDPTLARSWFPPEVRLRRSIATASADPLAWTATYADVLANLGWDRLDRLAPLVGFWRREIRRFDPDVVVLNSAPNAQLALHGCGIPCIGYGAPWFTPPPSDRMPPLEWWKPAPPGADAREDAVLDVVNQARPEGSPALAHLSALWRSQRTVVHGPPELDPWRDLRDPGVHYAGITAELDRGGEATWPQGEGPRVFAYLKPSYPHTVTVLNALQRLGCRTIAFVPGGGVSSTARTTVVPQPLALRGIREVADLCVAHSALTTGCAFLAGGVPGLFLPMQLEQLSSGRCASMRLRGAATLPATAVQTQLPLALRMILDPQVREAARAQARTWDLPADPVGSVARLVLDAGFTGVAARRC